MASAKQFVIKESLSELRKLQKAIIPMLSTRIRALIEFKKHESTGISKRDVAAAIGVNHNSVQIWRSNYIQGGLDLLLHYEKREGRPSVISAPEHEKLKEKLNDPQNGLRGYIELLDWAEKEFNKQLNYSTLLKYGKRHFGAKAKVARKSHVKKDEEAVEDFKKTSVKSVPRSGTIKKNTTKR